MHETERLKDLEAERNGLTQFLLEGVAFTLLAASVVVWCVVLA